MNPEMVAPPSARMHPLAEQIYGISAVGEGCAAGGDDNDRVYVAVGRDVKESKYNLMWVVNNFSGKRICLLHVLQPSQLVPFTGVNFPPQNLQQQVVVQHRDPERQSMQEVLKKYLYMLQAVGVEGEAVHVEKEKVEEGIVELMTLQRIKKLVMGAAANKHYDKKMVDIKSKTAKYVHERGLASCHIWFVCKGRLIKKREATTASDESQMPHRPKDCMLSMSDVSSLDGVQWADSPQNSDMTRDASDWNATFRTGSSQSCFSSLTSPCASHASSAPQVELELSRSEASSAPAGELELSRSEENGGGFGTELENKTVAPFKDIVGSSSPPSVLEQSVDDELYEQLEQAMAKADNSKREAFEESLRRRKAEKEAVDAARRAKAAEKMYHEEMRLRKQIEDAISREKQELEKMNYQQVAVMEELNSALSQKSLLERELADSRKQAEEFQDKIVSAVELLKNYRDERDKLENERDCALRATEELRQQAERSMSSENLPQFFSEFPYSEIQNATRNFHPSLKIGEGGYGSIYKGVLRYTDVAVKVLHFESMQGPSEYRQEVEVLSRLRHPNIVTLIGACPEAFTLIYEYLPNGSLEDRLKCKDNSSPLSWQTRIRIAAELCSVLVFLHSSKSHCIVHGDLKPSNILLDANFISKLSDFGICRAITPHQAPSVEPAASYITQPKGTFAYMDPEFIMTGELTPYSDIYSFGIILLMLLTGKHAVGIATEVRRALDNGNLNSLLDCSAGDWPYVQAQQLAHLALRCAAMNRRDRPELESEVLRVLEPMRASCRGSSLSSRLGDEEHCQAPPYFICPIFQASNARSACGR
uniref:RING-type E3 ubiquitin transferase n=1 Tax=Kalanchoe fedtschenkoi TaxID=63787 RepID=A0A7N0SZ70_KALFE